MVYSEVAENHLQGLSGLATCRKLFKEFKRMNLQVNSSG